MLFSTYISFLRLTQLNRFALPRFPERLALCHWVSVCRYLVHMYVYGFLYIFYRLLKRNGSFWVNGFFRWYFCLLLTSNYMSCSENSWFRFNYFLNKKKLYLRIFLIYGIHNKYDLSNIKISMLYLFSCVIYFGSAYINLSYNKHHMYIINTIMHNM